MTARLALSTLAAATLGLSAGSAVAADIANGERQWRQCRSCHMIVSPDGETIQNGGRVGPNLYGVIGRAAGSLEGFNYSAELSTLGSRATDPVVWDEENFVAYVQDPTAFIRAETGNSGVRAAMNFQMRSGAEDMYAYLAQFGGN